MDVNEKPLSMEIDTGATVSLISTATFKSLFQNTTLEKTSIRLRTYTGKPIAVAGQLKVKVRYKQYMGNHLLYVVKGSGLSLLGRDWLSHIRIDWASIKAVSQGEQVVDPEALLSQYPDVFKPDLGTITHIKAHLTLKPNAQPQFCRPRSVPFAIEEKVGKELDHLDEEAAVLRKVNHAEWAAPIVPVPKSRCYPNLWRLQGHNESVTDH